MKTILTAVTEQTLQAKAYLTEAAKNRKNIEKTEFIPPVIGKKGYGRFRVKYRLLSSYFILKK